MDIDVSIEVLEADGGDGGPKHDADFEIVGAAIDEDGYIDILVSLWAERSGQGDGRTYEITAAVTDDSGNTASAAVQVTVPHDQGKGKGKK